MSNCLPCIIPSILPKYEQHIQSLYPNKSSVQYQSSRYNTPEQYCQGVRDGYKPNNLSDIIRYAEMYPNKLPRIGESIYNKTMKHINKSYSCMASIGIYTMLALIESCHSDDIITLYDDWVLKLIDSLLVQYSSHTTIQHKQLGFELIVKLMLIQDNGADYYKYDGLWAYIVKYLINTPSTNDTHRLRYSCIRACTALCMYYDTHRAATHYRAVIPLLLNNIHTSTSIVEVSNIPIDPSWLGHTSVDTVLSIQPNPTELSTYTLWCYHTIINTVTLSDIESVLRPILSWLDNLQWNDNETSVQLLLTIANNQQLPYIDLVILRLVRHIEYVKQINNNDTAVMINNNNTPANQFSGVEMQSIATYTPAVQYKIMYRVANVINDIIIRASVEINNYQAVLDNLLNSLVNVTDIAHNHTLTDRTYTDKLCDCVLSMIQQFNKPQVSINILQLVLQRYHIHTTRSTSSTNQSVLLQLAGQLSIVSTCNLNTKYHNDKLMTTMIIAALCSTDLMQRDNVYTILINIMLPNDMKSINSLLMSISNKQSLTQPRYNYIMSANDHTWLLSLIYYELTSSITTNNITDPTDITSHIVDIGAGDTNATLIQSVWQVLIVLLLQSPNQRLQQQYSMIHKLYHQAQLSSINKLRINTFIFAYSTYVSLIYHYSNNKVAQQLDNELVTLYDTHATATATTSNSNNNDTGQQCDLTIDSQLGLVPINHTNNIPIITDTIQQLLSRLADYTHTDTNTFVPNNFRHILPELQRTVDISISYAPSRIVLQRSNSVVFDDEQNNTNNNNNTIKADDIKLDQISDTQAAREARGDLLTQRPSSTALFGLDEHEDTIPSNNHIPIKSIDDIIDTDAQNNTAINDIQIYDRNELYDDSASIELSNRLTDMYNKKWNQYRNKSFNST